MDDLFTMAMQFSGNDREEADAGAALSSTDKVPVRRKGKKAGNPAEGTQQSNGRNAFAPADSLKEPGKELVKEPGQEELGQEELGQEMKYVPTENGSSFQNGTFRMAPLADRMRPRNLGEFLGQKQLLGEGMLLRRAILADRLTSSIFWGPPGTGKTTLASIVANASKSAFARLNAVTSGVSDVRQVIADAQERLRTSGKCTYLLLDECHRFSKSQSDSLLPAVEAGIIRFIGSTTENPMVSITPALVSRCRLFRFEKLTREDILQALHAALSDKERGYGDQMVVADEEALEHIAHIANGDVRSALNALELAVLSTVMQSDGSIHITLKDAEQSIQAPVLQMDESMFYDMLSAFCKSLRGSDSDAALAWCARLLEAGVDPRIIVRRVIVHASEDVGMANPMAMLQAVAALQALENIGMPEASLSIGQAIIAVCESPKSNSVPTAVERAMEDARRGGYQPVPVHLRDTHYKGAEKIGSGDGYLYPHNFPGHYVEQQYAPLEAKGFPYYEPGNLGFEAEILKDRERRKNVSSSQS